MKKILEIYLKTNFIGLVLINETENSNENFTFKQIICNKIPLRNVRKGKKSSAYSLIVKSLSKFGCKNTTKKYNKQQK